MREAARYGLYYLNRLECMTVPTRQLLKRLARLDILLIDEFGYLNLKPEQSNIFFKLMEERYRHHATIITRIWTMTNGPTSWVTGPWWKRC